MYYLLVDIGSTFTKGSLVDTEKCRIIGHGKAITTIETSVMDGIYDMLSDLLADAQKRGNSLRPIHGKPFWDRALLCSSAAGGLKMIAVGLGRHLTAEAATRSALGAGARILKTYALELSTEDLREIERLHPDILLLSGGTNHGNRRSLVDHARKLATLSIRFPIVIAGNTEVADEAAEILAEFDVTVTENVMPQVNVLNADPARREIRRLFMERITHAKGLDEVNATIGPVLTPTPDAALQAARLLSLGTANRKGMGDLLLVDIGGATTDIHSVGKGKPASSRITIDGRTSELRVEGLQEPLDKRTVEGDLGMRYSAWSLYESVGSDALTTLYPADYAKECAMRAKHIKWIPTTAEDFAIDRALARSCAQVALSRHVGTLRRDYEKGRYVYYLCGKDLSSFSVILGTGGVLVHQDDPKAILRPDEYILLPKNPVLYLDKDYILSAMGLLATEQPDVAFDLLSSSLTTL